MRKNKLLVLFIFLLACNQNEFQHNNPEIESGTFHKQFSQALSQTLNFIKSKPLVTVIDQSEDGLTLRINVEEIVFSTDEYLETSFFEGSSVDYRRIELSQIVSLINSSHGARVPDLVTSIFEITSFYSQEQKKLLVPFVESISNLDDLNIGKSLINDFNEQVLNSVNLSEDEKIQLLGYSSSAFALIKFAENDGIEAITSSVSHILNSTEMGENGRTIGCSVDWRSVWGGAVASFTVGAIRGAIAGGTAGTVTIPGIGTASGIVGGAVFGGAAGFVSGTVTSIAANLLLTCGRPEATGCGGVGQPECIPDNQNQEMTGRTKEACNRMARMGVFLPPVCHSYSYYKYRVN